ncbi:MAG: tripartite tricarboxylate transporter substrate binding protein [Reyranellaceae bacterium]
MSLVSWLGRILLPAMLSLPAAAADFPTKPVTLVVPFAAGSTSDTSGRIVAQQMAKSFGQPVVVENKVGAGGTIAATFAARSKPDGYTMFWTSSSVQVIAPFVMTGLPWDPLKSFEPIGLSSRIPQILAVTPALPAKTFSELVALAKARPGGLTYATLGPNTTQNLIMSVIMKKLGIAMNQVPYSSAAQIYPDVLAGRVDLLLDNMPNVLPFARRGELRALAVTTRQRVAVLPDVPTVAESGLPDFEMVAWGGLAVPAGTPADVLAAIRDAYAKALASDEFRSWAESNGAIAATAQEFPSFAAFLQRELAAWQAAVEESGVSVGK